MFHPERVSEWLNGGNIYPIYVELSPSGACNHRCVFCALDFMGYERRFLDAEMLAERFAEIGNGKVKSISLAGEGEPLLHPQICKIAEDAKKSGIDVAFTTNGSLMDEETAARIMPVSSWIKVSCNAGTPETYSKIHRTGADMFDKVINNLTFAAALRAKHNWSCTLGLQIVLLPEVSGEVVSLAKLSRDIGLDYIVVKPYSQHLKSENRQYETVSYSNFDWLKNELANLNTPTFKAFFRANAMRKWDEKSRPYEKCLALPFWGYIDSSANLWGCSCHLKDKRFLYGNIQEQGFGRVWENGLAQRIEIEKSLDISECRVGCRMDEINRYLWELRHPKEHVNFI